jgi:hypothetical protein
MAFIGGHIFLLAFTGLQQLWILFALSCFIIIMQYKISKRKWKFKKDIVRIKKVQKKIKPICIKNEKTNQESSKVRS